MREQTTPARDRYPFKCPFPDECDRALFMLAQAQSDITYYEWNLKDFYRTVQVRFEPGTNTKSVFEKCVKLAR